MRAMAIFILLCFVFLAGCVPSTAQYSRMVKAINARTVLIGHTKEYMKREFGPPETYTRNRIEGKWVEEWVYQTRMGGSHTVINSKPQKIRYLKITFVNGFALDAKYE